MLRFWSLAFLPSLLCLAVTAPACADERLPNAPSDQLDTLRHQVQDLEKRVAALELRVGVPREDIAEMLKKLTDVQTQLRRYEVPRDPMRYNTPDAPQLVSAQTAPLRVVNLSAIDVNVRVNNQTWNVLPGQTALLPPQPSGPLVYEVFAESYGVLRAPVTRILKPGDPLTITVFPR